MGYRHYFYKIKNELVDEIKGMTLKELAEKFKADDEGYFDIHEIPQEEIFEFGKLYWDDTAERIYSKGTPMFEQKEVMDDLIDYVPYIVGKEGLLESIEIYKNKITNYYKDLLIDGKYETATIKQQNHIRDIASEWSRDFALNLNMDEESISNSWKYEYQIFEQARLLKTIDFSKYTILFYGW